MDAAERRIRSAGYHGFSFREIAADVGVKSASVHYHFPTKDALAAAVARRYTERFMASVDALTGETGDPVAAWIAVFRRALVQDGRTCLCGALGGAAASLSEEVSVEVRRFFELGIERLSASGLSGSDSERVLATLEGAMLLATVLRRPDVFDGAVAGLG